MGGSLFHFDRLAACWLLCASLAVGASIECSSKLAYLGQQSLRITVLLLLCMQSLAWSGNRALLNLARSSPSRRASPLVLKCSWSNKDKSKNMDFRVATYNILCSHLAEPARFPQCSPKNLDAPTRLKRVKHKLDAEVSRRCCSSRLPLLLLPCPYSELFPADPRLREGSHH